jgi:hypothetical protein
MNGTTVNHLKETFITLIHGTRLTQCYDVATQINAYLVTGLECE